jgi:hypothetical protein
MTEVINDVILCEKGDIVIDINCKKCQVFGFMGCNLCMKEHYCGYCDRFFYDKTLIPVDNEMWSYHAVIEEWRLPEDDITFTADDVGKEKYAMRACQRCFDEYITVLKFTD